MSNFSVLAAIALLASTTVIADPVVHDIPAVNGHDGYMTAWETSGPVDKVLMVVKGFDTNNEGHPAEDLYDDFQPMIDELGPNGWDIVVFDYVDGSDLLENNAENLAHFINYLNTQATEDYHLAIVGGSMGGIVTRTMFVQENSNLGVDTFVSLDSPHWGVYLSEWVRDLAELALDFPAAHQMNNGDPAFNEHYGWLRSVETNGTFLPEVIDPMATLAIALSDGRGSWDAKWEQVIFHTPYHAVSSYVSASDLESDYMPYHSTTYMDDTSTSSRIGWGETEYWYNDTSSSYFDESQANPRSEHGGPEFAVRQAVDFILANGP